MHTVAANSIWSDLFTFDIPPTEKILRTVLVYAAVGLLIRVFGRRILAQLNLSDLVVVLLLSNVVQNAIIGADNSLAGGLLGAFTLVAVDYLFDRVVFMIRNSERLFDGRPVTLVKDGQVDTEKLRRVGIREMELTTILHRLGADRVSEEQNANAGELEAAVQRIEQRIDERFAALEALVSR
jgi:uncharacterized membrane protein YcaP (DUF421 family)